MREPVYLIGAGPGDPGLLTVRGKEILQQADCVIYDRLVGKNILDFCRQDCELIYVGKQASHHTLKQEGINQLLIEKAKQGKRIVRLKGGDVYVFGRGGEEALALSQEGLSCQVVPGISSCIAGLAYAGIPITHRGLSHGFQVVTAHDKTDSLTDLNFAKMATSQDTLVFLMGLSKLEEITKKLQEAGMDPNTKCAVISQATCPTQKTISATLATIFEEVQKANLVSPALIVVGEVVSLQQQLNFFEKSALFGKKIVIAHPESETSKLTTLLQQQGAQCEEVKTGMIKRLPLDLTKQKLDEVSWLLFTSRHGVDSFFGWLKQMNYDARRLAHVKIATVGTGSAQQLKKYGLIADLLPRHFCSEELVKELNQVCQPDQQVLVIKAQNSVELTLPMLKVISMDGYVNQPIEVSKLDWSDADLVCFSCASAVTACCKNKENRLALQQLSCVSMGPKTSQELRNNGIEHFVEVKQSRFEVMYSTILDYFSGDKSYVAD